MEVVSHADGKSTSMWGLRLFPATQELQKSQQALCNTLLAAASLEKLTSLFLVLFPSVFSVAYRKLRSPAQHVSVRTPGMLGHQSPTSCTSGQHAQIFAEAQECLLRRLAQRMTYIAEKTDLLAHTIFGNISLKAGPANEIEKPCFNARMCQL